jgi:SAM-dependent methyltransferase
VCNVACIAFGSAHLLSGDVRGKKVIEVGSLNENGSLRSVAEGLGPSSYLGVDIAQGPGVDEICDAVSLRSRYGEASFDVVISTEALEHMREWRDAISNMKSILRPQGVLLVTTRSKGFPYHGYPDDFWRFEPSDMESILADLSLEVLQADPWAPGVFVRCRKPDAFVECDLAHHELYSIVVGKRCRDISNLDIAALRLARLRDRVSEMLPPSVKSYVRKMGRGLASSR